MHRDLVVLGSKTWRSFCRTCLDELWVRLANAPFDRDPQQVRDGPTPGAMGASATLALDPTKLVHSLLDGEPE